jgi:hypothetical protein
MKQACCCQAQFAASVDRRFEFQKRRQFFIRTHNETLSVIAMGIRDKDCSPVGTHYWEANSPTGHSYSVYELA